MQLTYWIYQKLGRMAEAMACGYLMLQGYRCIKMRYACRRGEVDLVMLSPRGLLVFVEVRYRCVGVGRALESIDRGKRLRICKTAEYFILRHPQYAEHVGRFDVVAVAKFGWKITHIPAAFEQEKTYR